MSVQRPEAGLGIQKKRHGKPCPGIQGKLVVYSLGGPQGKRGMDLKREHELGQTAEARKRTDRDLRCIGWGLVLLGVLMPAW